MKNVSVGGRRWRYDDTGRLNGWLCEAKEKGGIELSSLDTACLRTSLMRFTSFAGDGQTTLRCVSKPSTPIDVLAFRFALHLSWGNYTEDENRSQ